MNKQEFSLKSNDGINDLAGYNYKASSDFLKGVVVIIHGMNDHSARFEGFITYLNAKGYAVVAYDQLGHGRTARTKDDLGFFGEERGNEYLVSDAKLMVDQAKIWYKKVPIILLGHSMGSNVGRYFVEKYPQAINGFIQMGSMGGDSNFMYGINSFLLKLLIVFQGKKGRSKFIAKMAFGPYIKRIENPVNSSAWLSKDDEVCRAYQKDKYCAYITTLQAFKDIVDLRQHVNSPAWFAALNRSLPWLIVSGAEDPCGNYGEAIKEIHAKLRDKTDDLTMILYPGDRHEILNELDKEVVYADIEKWLNHLCTKNVYQG